MYKLKKSIRLRWVVMIIKNCKTFDRITPYSYGTNAFKVCESEMLSKYNWLILMIAQMKAKLNII